MNNSVHVNIPTEAQERTMIVFNAPREVPRFTVFDFNIVSW